MTQDAHGGSGSRNHYENVPCPFCGILCDDIEIGPTADGLKVLKNGCAKSISGFERRVPAASPQIAGRDVPLAEAIREAARLLKASRLPLFTGLGTDVAGMQAVLAAADKAGGVVDHALSDSSYRNYRVLQSSGWVMTTLTEARNRADLFIIVATDLTKLHPRFFERIVCNDKSMFSDAPPKRTVVLLGDGLDASAVAGARIGEVVTLPVKADRIGEVIDALRAMSKGFRPSGDDIGGLTRASVEDLLARCKSANYGVIAWSPSSLAFPSADLTVQAICEFVKEINATSRFAGLPLGGSEASTTAGAVCAWQTGFPLRVSFASGKIQYDVDRYAASSMVTSKESDLIIWIATFSADFTPPDTDTPLILIATPGVKTARTPAVSIPVGTPGVDHTGSVMRVDSSVTLPLRKVRQSSLPSAADVVAQIEAAL